MLGAEFVLLPRQHNLQLFFRNRQLHDLLLFDLSPHNLSTIVVFNTEEDFLLLLFFNDVFGAPNFGSELFSDSLGRFDHFLLLFHLELFDELERSLFIIGHVLVPGLLELSELCLLRPLNIH